MSPYKYKIIDREKTDFLYHIQTCLNKRGNLTFIFIFCISSTENIKIRQENDPRLIFQNSFQANQ